MGRLGFLGLENTSKTQRKHVKTEKTKVPVAQKHAKTRVFRLAATLASKALGNQKTRKNTCFFNFAEFADIWDPSKNTQKHVKSDTCVENT